MEIDVVLYSYIEQSGDNTKVSCVSLRCVALRYVACAALRVLRCVCVRRAACLACWIPSSVWMLLH